MQYNQTIQLRDGRACVLRHALAEDAAAVIDNFNLTHGETDYLLTYPDESRSDVAAEARFLQAKAASANEVEIIAQVGDGIAGTAGIDAGGGRGQRSWMWWPTTPVPWRCTPRQALRSMAAIPGASDPARRGIRNWCICGWRCECSKG